MTAAQPRAPSPAKRTMAVYGRRIDVWLEPKGDVDVALCFRTPDGQTFSRLLPNPAYVPTVFELSYDYLLYLYRTVSGEGNHLELG